MGMTAAPVEKAKMYLVFRVHQIVPPETGMKSSSGARSFPPKTSKKQMRTSVAAWLLENEESLTKTHGFADLLSIPVQGTRTIEVAAPLWIPMMLLKKPVKAGLIVNALQKGKLLVAVVFVA